jgi:hypothetical protein
MPRIPIEARRRTTAAKLAALTLTNALIFQEELSQVETRVEPIRRLLDRRDFHSATADHWGFICDQINYVPIFHLARQVLLAIPSHPDTSGALRTLAHQALEIVSERAALRHDLMGRVYHYLLLEAKYLGTFYTSVPAATLLLKLALSSSSWAVDWSEAEAVGALKIGDLACGTGTLLMAASQAITDNFVRARVRAGKEIDGLVLRGLHQAIMEDVLHGYDVLPSAVHLTASTLALLAPEIAFQKMQLYSLPLGKFGDNSIFLGSIEYLNQDRVGTQLDLMGSSPRGGAAGALSGTGTAASVAPLPQLDLCVMNPPFVRSVNSNLLFGSLPRWRKEMQRELARRLNAGRTAVLASVTAGLGSVFAAIGDRHVKEGGRLALVVPAAITSGGSWSKTRSLLDNRYRLEFIIASHDASRWSFSENTDLSEVLIVARKRGGNGDATANSCCTFINLWKNPTATADALSLGESMSAASAASVSREQLPTHGIAPLNIGTEKWGEALSIPLAELNGQPWLGCAFAHTELVRLNWRLRRGELVLPGRSRVHTIPLCPLEAIGRLGPDGRDIHDGFTLSRLPTPYPAFWNHDAGAVVTVNQQPNTYLSPRARAAPGRPARPAGLLWPKAGGVLVAVRLWFNTHRLTAVRVDTPVLSNVWYPVQLVDDSDLNEKALVLWLNSTLGLLLIAGHRVPTRGPWVQFKKPTWNPMPVLDIRRLPRRTLAQLSSAYDRLIDRELGPLPRMGVDPVRAEIDAVISSVFELPSLAPLRDLLAEEPIISNIALWQTGATAAPAGAAEQFGLLLPEGPSA